MNCKALVNNKNKNNMLQDFAMWEKSSNFATRFGI